jgi:RNA polymerase sigma-70 factor (ECF subfamily)
VAAVIGFSRSGHNWVMTSAAFGPNEHDDPPADPAPRPLAIEVRPERSLADLVHRHLDFVWRLLRRLGLSDADAEDAAQQVLLVAASKLEQIEPGKTRTFLYGTAVHVASNARRSARRQRRAHVDHEVYEAARKAIGSRVPWPDELTDLARARALLNELLEGLPDELRRVLVLAEIEELTLPEIAELEAIPLGTATSRLRRARERFAELRAAQRQRIPFGAVE